MPTTESVELPEGPDGKTYVHVSKNTRRNKIGDRIWVNDDVADESDDYTPISEDERREIRRQAKLEDDLGQAEPTYVVRFQRPFEAYTPGDRAGFKKSYVEGRGLIENGVVTLEEKQGNTDAQADAEATIEDRKAEINDAYGYQEQRSLAADVADEVDGEPASRSSDDITQFLAQHYDVVQRLKPGDDE